MASGGGYGMSAFGRDSPSGRQTARRNSIATSLRLLKACQRYVCLLIRHETCTRQTRITAGSIPASAPTGADVNRIDGHALSG